MLTAIGEESDWTLTNVAVVGRPELVVKKRVRSQGVRKGEAAGKNKCGGGEDQRCKSRTEPWLYRPMFILTTLLSCHL